VGNRSSRFNNPSFSFDVAFTDGNTHQFALYSLDWNSGGRVETVQIVDPSNNAVLDTETASRFSGGIYFVWNISGNVEIIVTVNSGANAVISGGFFNQASLHSGWANWVGRASVQPVSLKLRP
jgi:hypothetical protein